MHYDLLIEAGHTATSEKSVRMGVRNGKIHRLDGKQQIRGPTIGGERFLLAPGFVEPHYHMDKCFLGEGSDPRLSLREQLERYKGLKRSFTAETVAQRVIRAGRLLSKYGLTHVRTFADVDVFGGLVSLEGVLRAREQLEPWIAVQVIAFAQHGVFVHDGSLSLLTDALAMGVDGIGGHPQLEDSFADSQRQIETLFELAENNGVAVDFHVDETDDPSSLWIERCASLAAESHVKGGVTLAHANTLSLQDSETRQRVYDLLVAADISLVSSPTSALLFRHAGHPAGPRGIPPIHELLERGVNVAIGQEVFASQFAEHLRLPDPLLTGQVMAYTAQLADKKGLGAVFQMLTGNGAKALRLPSYGIDEGSDANLVLMRAESVQDALTDCPERLVVRAGRLVAHLRHDVSTDPSDDTLSRPLASTHKQF